MATFSANFGELLETTLKEIYFKRYNQQPKLYPQIFNVETSNSAFQDALKISGLGTLAVKGEGQAITYDDPVQGTRKRTVHTTYALGFRVTMEMQMDDLFNIISKMPDDLADSTINHQENLAWGLVNDSFAGTLHTGLEGDTFIATGHVLLKTGGTHDNLQSPAIALSVSGLEDMHIMAKTLVDESGRFTPVNLQTLLVPSELDFEAQRLLETDREPGTNEWQINTMNSSRTGVQPLTVPYLTDPDAYWLIARKEQHSARWFNRMATRFDRSKDSQTKDDLFDVMYRAHVTFDDWRGWWGSTG